MLFNTTKSLIFKNGASSSVGELLARQGLVKPFVVTDSFLNSSGLLDSCLSSIKNAESKAVVFDQVVPDPTESNVLAATEMARANGCDSVIGFGGGSPMDVAKVAAFLASPAHATQPSLADCYGVDQIRGSRLPLIQIPTTAGTGSEVTPISILTTGASTKMGIVSSLLLPDYAVLDGSLTVSVPQMTTAHTGIDAMIHAIEAFTCLTAKNQLSDILAREALCILGKNIRTAVYSGEDEHARGQMLFGSMLAGMSFANSPVAAVHALAYPLGSLWKVPHGLSCSLMLKPVMRFNAHVCSDLYAELGECVFEELRGQQGGNEVKCDRFLDKMEELQADLGLPSTLSEVGVKEEDVDTLVSESMKQVRLLPNNPREVGPEEARSIYHSIL